MGKSIPSKRLELTFAFPSSRMTHPSLWRISKVPPQTLDGVILRVKPPARTHAGALHCGSHSHQPLSLRVAFFNTPLPVAAVAAQHAPARFARDPSSTVLGTHELGYTTVTETLYSQSYFLRDGDLVSGRARCSKQIL